MREFHSFLAPQILQFIHYRQSSQNWSSSSEKNLFYFDRHCSEHYPDAVILTREMVDSWCLKRPTENNGSCTKRSSIVRSLVSFLNMRGYSDIVLPDPPKDTRTVYIPHFFTDDELLRFFQACDNIRAYDRRNSKIRKLTIPVFFRLLYSSGIRTNEARLLKRGDVNLTDGVLNIQQSKGYNQHYVVLHDSMLELMKNYDSTVDALLPDREYFFPSPRNGHYNCGWVVKTFNDLWKESNPETHARAYDLRHNYAITNINRWVGQGFEFHDKLVYLSKSMGHSKLESTRYYYSIVPVLSQILEEKTAESSDWIMPEVPNYEEIN